MNDPLVPVSAVSFADIEDAAARLAGTAHRTPTVTSRTVDAQTGAQVFFKCEALQRAGAFKFRGAYNALVQFSVEERARGALTYSSGNHAQALALAGRILQIPTSIVMPEDAPAVKRAATRGYGGEVILYDKHNTIREELGRKLAEERGLTVIPPYDHPHVIAGQGTVAKELLEDVGPLDLIFAPCGGGGLLSGTALAAAALSPGCRVIGVEPEAADDASRSFKTRTLVSVHNPDTIADGARTPSLGRFTFPVILEHVSDIVTVSEQAIVDSMLFIWERLKIVVEPTGALAAAAVLHGSALPKGARVGVVLSGGNLDVRALSALLETGSATGSS